MIEGSQTRVKLERVEMIEVDWWQLATLATAVAATRHDLIDESAYVEVVEGRGYLGDVERGHEMSEQLARVLNVIVDEDRRGCCCVRRVSVLMVMIMILIAVVVVMMVIVIIIMLMVVVVMMIVMVIRMTVRVDRRRVTIVSYFGATLLGCRTVFT